MKILFCQLRNHGDIIRSFPLLDAIKFYHPDWYIGYTCFFEMEETCRLSDSIDVIIPQPRFSPVTDTQGGTRILDCSAFAQIVERVRKEQFNLYLDLHGVFQSALFGAMCDIKMRLGRSHETTKDGATLFYTDICEIKERKLNRMERHFIVFNKLFPEVKPISQSGGELKTANKIVVFPGSSKMGILKRWNTERYAKIGELLKPKYQVKYILGPEEQEVINTLQNNTSCEIQICSTWEQIANEIENSKLVVGNDGAYVHLAIWKNVPVVMICGPLSPTINGIWKYGKGETVSDSEYCKCPDVWKGICDNNHRCMEQISVDEVMQSIKKYLG